ncbi:putative hydrolase [Hyphodiscus hymeniophilus]|uniref:Hydrolase n=1 Tax=Hyphodiscus hymeniophilus TaxID=353542 RepID=A0A9P6VFM7_9HELO|nr:putative hydrolase [Hyphodiscus hymeniophilus]
MPSKTTYATIENEDCNLHYWYHGSGPLLIFVPGGNGQGRQYDALMNILGGKYTVATFDRRQMSASLVKGPNKLFNPCQQARDIIAVMKAIGRETTSIFASSGGGIIGFQMAVSYPSTLDHMVCHEAPTTVLLSAKESTDLIDFFSSLYDIYREGGVTPTMDAFTKKIMVGMEHGPPRKAPEPHNPVNQFENEMMMGMYCPDLAKIVENGTSVAVGFGTLSEGAMYRRTVVEQAKRLGCEMMEFPGHHQWFETRPDEFAPVLLALLDRMEKKRKVEREV